MPSPASCISGWCNFVIDFFFCGSCFSLLISIYDRAISLLQINFQWFFVSSQDISSVLVETFLFSKVIMLNWSVLIMSNVLGSLMVGSEQCAMEKWLFYIFQSPRKKVTLEIIRGLVFYILRKCCLIHHW